MLSHSGVIEVVEDGSTIDTRRNFLQSLALSVQEGSVHLGGELGAAALVALTENIINVNESSLILELLINLLANGRKRRRVRRIDVREITTVCCVSIVKAIADKTVIVCHVEVGSIAIIFPVSNTVTYHEALEFGDPSSGVLGQGTIDPSVNSQSELRDIDAGIGLTGKIKVIVLKGSELVLEKIEYSNKVVISRVCVIELAFRLITAN